MAKLPKLYKNVFRFAFDYYRDHGETEECSIDLAARDAQAILYRYVDGQRKIQIPESVEGHAKSIKTKG